MSLAGKVRMARLTDLAPLGELSRLAQTDAARSLGLPVTRPRMGVFSLFRLPLGAFQPNDLLYVYEEDRRISGLLRVERDSHRDEWTVVELDGIGQVDAGDIRFRLVQHLLRDGARRGALRFHVACADADGNVELFMQAGFARYGEEKILFRDSVERLPEPWDDEHTNACGIRPADPLDALALARLYSSVTPQPVQRLEAYRLLDWERQGAGWRVPRSSLTPILRFADVEAFVQDQSAGAGGDATELSALIQVAVAKEDQPHYIRILARPESDVAPLVEYGLGVIAARTGNGQQAQHGVISSVRTYESPIDRRFEEAGFELESSVTLLLREAMIRVAEPALVPAIR